MLLPLLLSFLPGDATTAARSEKVVLHTEDKFVITGDYHPPRGVAKGTRAPAVLLVHDAGGSRADLEGIAEILAASKVGAFRLDLRGHGESKTVEGKTEPFDWKKADMVGDKPFLKMHRELAAAAEWLRGRPEVDVDRMGIVGLGSGGSLALRFASREEAFRAAVLVSLPGLSDRGFDLTEDLKRLDGRSVLLVSDREGSGVAKDLQKFAAQYPDAKPLETRVTKEEGAGAALLKAEKGLDRALAGWIRDRLAPAKKG